MNLATEGCGKTVLLAEDDDACRSVLRKALCAMGYAVVEVSDGAQALEALSAAAGGARVTPDVVMLDVRMPGYSGLGVLNAMRRLPSAPPTLLMTGMRDPSLEVFARRMGAFAILRKPLDLDEVLGKVLEAARRGTTR